MKPNRIPATMPKSLFPVRAIIRKMPKVEAMGALMVRAISQGVRLIGLLTLDITGQAACGLVRVDGLVRAHSYCHPSFVATIRNTKMPAPTNPSIRPRGSIRRILGSRVFLLTIKKWQK